MTADPTTTRECLDAMVVEMARLLRYLGDRGPYLPLEHLLKAYQTAASNEQEAARALAETARKAADRPSLRSVGGAHVRRH